jgi:predicted  nucleic acid-binding Zn-ribbon protein
MDKDSPRRQPVEETQRQLDAKLREANRQRSLLEAELESASERWRTERRQLNAEVDRLETALAEARATGRKPIGTKPDRAIDPLELARIHAAADDRILKASKAWEAEREKLLTEVSRLQRAIGDMLERANNPLRSSAPMREDLETKLTLALRAREKAESVYLREKASWDEEKLRMTGEIIRLRNNSALIKAARGKPGVDDRAQELEIRVSAMQKEMDRERAEWRQQIQQMERRLSETHQSVNSDVVDQLRRQYDDRIQEIILQKTQLTDELTRASALLESKRGRFMTATESGNADAVSAEVARVQTMILELGKRIDDPTTDLSTVIRKNVERAELTAYLKGIQYSTGNNKGI